MWFLTEPLSEDMEHSRHWYLPGVRFVACIFTHWGAKGGGALVWSA